MAEVVGTKPPPPSDEEMRKLLKPVPAPDAVLEILQAHYATAVSCKVLQQLDSYDDCNYKVEIDGTFYLLKIHNGVESRDFLKVYEAAGRDYSKHAGSVIHLQNAIAETLAQNGIPTASLVLPNSNSNNNGSQTTTPVLIETLPVVSADHSPTQLVVKLLAWVPGRTLSSLQMLPLEVLAEAGRTLGRVDAALDRLGGTSSSNGTTVQQQPPDASIWTAARRYHQWDGRHTADLRPFVPCIADEKRRGLVESVLAAFERQRQEMETDFRRGMNHGDFNDANILVDEDFHVSGVIDFGDSVER